MTQAESAAPPRTDQPAARHPPEGPAVARAYRDASGRGRDIAVAVLDVSEGGVRPPLREELPPGQEFLVSLDGPATPPVKVVARLAWSVPAADANFVVGASFQAAISFAGLLTPPRL
jgi:PilZ domain